LVSSLEIYPTNLKKIVLADAYGNTIDSVDILTLTHGQHQLMVVP
jgi:hypothetical protein